MLGLLFLKVFTAWKTSTTLCLLAISHTMLLAQNTPLRPPPFLGDKMHNLIFRLNFFLSLSRSGDATDFLAQIVLLVGRVFAHHQTKKE